MKWTAAKNEFITGIYSHQQYHLLQCWDTPGKAFKEYNTLGSEIQKLKAAREKNTIALSWTVFLRRTSPMVKRWCYLFTNSDSNPLYSSFYSSSTHKYNS